MSKTESLPHSNTPDLHSDHQRPQQDFLRYEQLINCHTHPSTHEKILAAISVFNGREYAFDPCGDGPLSDIDHRQQLHTLRFDCMTFCNIVLAMIHSKTYTDLIENHINIRYINRDQRYFFRHHFIETTWTQHNRQQQYLTGPISSQLTLSSPRTSSLTLNYPAWINYQKTYIEKTFKTPFTPSLHSVPDLYNTSLDIPIEYIPIEQLVSDDGVANTQLLHQIPPGCIMQLICADWDPSSQPSIPKRMLKIATRIAVIHLGFITKPNTHLIFSHANIGNRVTSMALDAYLLYIRRELPYINGIYLESVA